MKLTLSFLLIASITFSCKRDFSSSAMTEDEKSIRSIRELSNRSIALHDTVTISNAWTTDYHMITSRNSEVSGRDIATKKFVDEFKSRPDVFYIRTPKTIQVFTAWKMASEQGEWTGRWRDKESIIEVGGTYFAKWHKVDNKWLIRAEVFVPLKCEGGKFCDQSPL